MRKLQLPLTESDIDTREKRRRAVSVIADEVFRIRIAEERYMNLIPENLRSGYPYLYARRAEADLFDAYITLSEAFEPF